MSASAISNDAITDALQRAKQLATVPTNTASKRPSSDDLNLHPSKRSNGGDMAGMGMGGPVENLIETVDIPENVVGLVIGRGGEQITNIQQQSGCRVQMAQEQNGTGVRQCTLQGSRPCVERARQLISDVISRNRNSSSSNGASGGGRGDSSGGGGGNSFVTQQLLIPGTKCGLIIGKNGETIKSLQETIGVKMLLIQENQAVSMGPKPLRITGYADKVEQAKRAVEQLLNNEEGATGTRNIMNQPKSIGEVIVPRTSVGIIIGKGGDTIKRLATDSNTKIQFKPDDDPSTPERCAVIQGTPEQINRATQMIWDLVQRSTGTQQQEMCLMHVPANKTGLVIGKGGDTIKQICNESGAHVELSRDPPPNATEKVFVIKGSPYQIHNAQHIIRIKVGDIAPGTPVPPFPGMPQAMGAQFPGQFPAATDQFNPPQQWQQANGFAPANQDPQWAQYYNQQQAAAGGFVQGGQPQFAAGQAFQQTGQQALVQTNAQPVAQAQQAAVQQGAPQAAPAINPTTGQPDYSAQWAEYYRSVGLHDQAALIEQNMKGFPNNQQQAQQAQQRRPQVGGQPQNQYYATSQS